MKTMDIKTNLHQEIEGLNSRQLKDIFGLFQDYINSNDDTDQWESLSGHQKEKIIAGLRQADANKTKPLSEITARLRKKYNTNG